MSTDNIVPIKQPWSPREQLLVMLNELAAYVSIAPDDEQFAIALFTRGSEEDTVHCGGFADDKAAMRYLQAFIRNQGFAE